MTTRLKRKRTEEWLEEVGQEVMVDVLQSLNTHMGDRIHEVNFPLLCEVAREVLKRPEYYSVAVSPMLNEIETMGPDEFAVTLKLGLIALYCRKIKKRI